MRLGSTCSGVAESSALVRWSSPWTTPRRWSSSSAPRDPSAPTLPSLRARDAAHASKLYDLRVTDAVPETIEASLQLSEAALIDIGIPMGLVIASIHEKRDEFRRMLQAPERERHAFRTPRPLPGE